MLICLEIVPSLFFCEKEENRIGYLWYAYLGLTSTKDQNVCTKELVKEYRRGQVIQECHICSKYWDNLTHYHTCLKFLTCPFYSPLVRPKTAGWVANSVDPDQTPRSVLSDVGQHCFITKTRLFKYIENFISKNWKFSDKTLRYFSNFCTKHRLWVLVRTASPRRF